MEAIIQLLCLTKLLNIVMCLIIYSIDHKPCGQLQPCHIATKNKNNVEHIQ